MTTSNRQFIRGFFALILACFAGLGSAWAQAFTKDDSGWVRLFKPTTTTDWGPLYSRVYGATAPLVSPPASPYIIQYPGTDTATIRVNTTANGGNIGTDDSTFSHYRCRVEYRHDVASTANNAGITYHTDESVPRMSNNWPRSIECQMKQDETGSAFSIQQCTFTSRTAATGAMSNYVPTGGVIVQVCEFGCNGRSYRGNPFISGGTQWNRMQIVIRGTDSAIHIVNDQVVFKLWDIRLTNNTGGRISPIDHGRICLQAEGSLVNYRRWEIMQFPPATPYSEHFLHRLFLDNPDVGVTMAGNSTYLVRWRTIGSTGTTGTVPNVTLEYAIGAGAWTNIATGLANTGSYNWTVPNQATTQLRLRVSAAAWVWADSSSGYNTITTGVPVAAPKPSHPLKFTVAGKGILLSGIQDYRALEVRDVFGRLVRSMSIQDRDLNWDLIGAEGKKVLPGLYFIRVFGNGHEKMARTLIF